MTSKQTRTAPKATRITMLTTGLGAGGGGVWTALLSQAQALAARGCAVSLVGPANPDSPAPVLAPLTVHSAPSWGRGSMVVAPSLWSVLKGTNPDIVHQHGLWTTPSLVTRRWRQQGGASVISPHGMLDPWALRNAAWKKKLAGHAFEFANLQDAQCLHALNQAECDAIRGLGFRAPIVMIPNGVDMSETDAPAGPPPWTGHIPQGAPVLLHLGRVHRKKGLDLLIGALALRRAGAADWHLAICGWDDGGEMRRLIDFAQAQGLASRVHLLGPVFGPQKHAALAQADAFVLASHSEGLPMAVLEAWSYRRPVVMTHACNLPEGAQAGAAIAVDTSIAALCDGLATLDALSPTARRAMGQAGRDLVETRFAWPQIARRHAAAYDWILGGGAAPADIR